MRGVDFDNDSVFMNERVVDWCREQGLEVTRARAYRKNDQAWVEQKNGAIVSTLVGYGRFEGLEFDAALTRLYEQRVCTPTRPTVVQTQEQTRIGARVVKQYHPPVRRRSVCWHMMESAPEPRPVGRESWQQPTLSYF